jgi:hypothetical protein
MVERDGVAPSDTGYGLREILAPFARAEQIRAQASPLMLAGARKEGEEILRTADRHWYVLGARVLDTQALERLRAAMADPDEHQRDE